MLIRSQMAVWLMLCLVFPVIVRAAQEEAEESGWESDGGIPPNVVFVLTAFASCSLGWACRDDLRILAMLLMWTFTYALMIQLGSVTITYAILLFDFMVYRFVLYPIKFQD
mmetsp:Transcript_5970/g.7276  ORF Transcript_5970/g.7276 Transcript_5970/m.7276 type:complete len:111 (+) Transcript_5970:109-441(+)